MFQDAKLYEKAYDQAVRKNEEAIAAIEEFKKELEGVKQTLEENQKHLFQRIMAPLAGGKALIKAKLIHTNDVMVFLGDKWFVRTSSARAIEICNRKIARCDENKAEIELQTERFRSNREKVQEYEPFSGADLREIVEPYDEEAEKLWKEKHREKVREFKKQEAIERNKYSDENIFKKLNGVEEDNNSECNETDEDTDLDSTDEDEDSVNENMDLIQSTDSKKRVSFSATDELKCYFPLESDDDTNIILFKHSDAKPSPALKTERIESPSDIYQTIVQGFNPKSILKKGTHLSPEKQPQSTVTDGHREIRNDTVHAGYSLLKDREEVVFGDISEKNPTMVTKIDTSSRKPSQFRKARNKQ